MAGHDFTVARLRELQIEAEGALKAAREAFARVERAIAKIDGELEHLERPEGARGQRGAFASPMQAMLYIAIWLAYEGSDGEGGVTEGQFAPYLAKLAHERLSSHDDDKLTAAIDSGRGNHFTVSRGAYTLLPNGLRAVQLHWDKVSGIPANRKPPL